MSLKKKIVIALSLITLVFFVAQTFFSFVILDKLTKDETYEQIHKINANLETQKQKLANRIMRDFDLQVISLIEVSKTPLLHRVWFKDSKKIEKSNKTIDEIKNCYNNLNSEYSLEEGSEYTLRCIEMKLASKFIKSISFQANQNLSNVIKSVFKNKNIFSVQIFDSMQSQIIGLKKIDASLVPIEETEKINDKYNFKEYQVKDNQLSIGTIKIGYAMHELDALEKEFHIELKELDRNSQEHAKFYFEKLFSMNLILSFMQIFSLSIVLLYLLNRLIITPIRSMSISANNFVLGKGSNFPEVKANDEIGHLNNNFGLMVKRIKEHVDLIEETSKELAQNVAIVQTVQSIAHDVKKPFITMKMILDRLRQVETIEDSQKFIDKYSGWLQDNISLVESLISDLLMFGGSDKVYKEKTNVYELIMKVLNNAFLNIKNIDLQLNLDKDIICNLDADKFYRVIKNIVENALDVNPKNIWIHLKSSDNKNVKNIQIIIGNDNSFIDSEKRLKIFDPFFTEGKESGTGLGLAICSKIVKHHGGAISCHSTQKYGTEFSILIPK